MATGDFEKMIRRRKRQASTSPKPHDPVRPEMSPRVALPANLPEALKYLHDDQLKTLLKDVSSEIERRTISTNPKSITPEPPPRATQKKQSAPSAKLTAASDEGRDVPEGKANLIRASFRAGMKPPAIAKTVGVSQPMCRSHRPAPSCCSRYSV